MPPDPPSCLAPSALGRNSMTALRALATPLGGVLSNEWILSDEEKLSDNVSLVRSQLIVWYFFLQRYCIIL